MRSKPFEKMRSFDYISLWDLIIKSIIVGPFATGSFLIGSFQIVQQVRAIESPIPTGQAIDFSTSDVASATDNASVSVTEETVQQLENLLEISGRRILEHFSQTYDARNADALEIYEKAAFAKIYEKRREGWRDCSGSSQKTPDPPNQLWETCKHRRSGRPKEDETSRMELDQDFNDFPFKDSSKKFRDPNEDLNDSLNENKSNASAKSSRPQDDPANVVLILLDAVSHRMALRALPKTMDFLLISNRNSSGFTDDNGNSNGSTDDNENSNGFTVGDSGPNEFTVFDNYHIVGQGSPDNQYPMAHGRAWPGYDSFGKAKDGGGKGGLDHDDEEELSDNGDDNVGSAEDNKEGRDHEEEKVDEKTMVRPSDRDPVRTRNIVQLANRAGFRSFVGCATEPDIMWACEAFWQHFAQTKVLINATFFDPDKGVCTLVDSDTKREGRPVCRKEKGEEAAAEAFETPFHADSDSEKPLQFRASAAVLFERAKAWFVAGEEEETKGETNLAIKHEKRLPDGTDNHDKVLCKDKHDKDNRFDHRRTGKKKRQRTFRRKPSFLVVFLDHGHWMRPMAVEAVNHVDSYLADFLRSLEDCPRQHKHSGASCDNTSVFVLSDHGRLFRNQLETGFSNFYSYEHRLPFLAIKFARQHRSLRNQFKKVFGEGILGKPSRKSALPSTISETSARSNVISKEKSQGTSPEESTHLNRTKFITSRNIYGLLASMLQELGSEGVGPQRAQLDSQPETEDLGELNLSGKSTEVTEPTDAVRAQVESDSESVESENMVPSTRRSTEYRSELLELESSSEVASESRETTEPNKKQQRGTLHRQRDDVMVAKNMAVKDMVSFEFPIPAAWSLDALIHYDWGPQQENIFCSEVASFVHRHGNGANPEICNRSLGSGNRSSRTNCRVLRSSGPLNIGGDNSDQKVVFVEVEFEDASTPHSVPHLVPQGIDDIIVTQNSTAGDAANVFTKNSTVVFPVDSTIADGYADDYLNPRSFKYGAVLSFYTSSVWLWPVYEMTRYNSYKACVPAYLQKRGFGSVNIYDYHAFKAWKESKEGMAAMAILNPQFCKCWF